MAGPRNLPFQYMIRANSLSYIDGPEHTQAVEARDAELEDYLAQLRKEFDDYKAANDAVLNAKGKGIVAVGTMNVTPTEPQIGPGIIGSVTMPLTMLTRAGRYYRIALRVRALELMGNQVGGVSVNLSINTGTNIGDHWVYIAGNFQGFNHEWLFPGSGGNNTFIGQMHNGTPHVLHAFTSTDCHFYVEDLGVIQAP